MCILSIYPRFPGAVSISKDGVALTAACHTAEGSARPQILKRNSNPSIYDLIETFSLKTNIGALFNTRFNLHSFTLVRTIKNAIYVLQNSELDGLILPGHLVLIRNRD